MKTNKKLLGEERRLQLLELLKNRNEPVTGNELAKISNVSRQVIVGDITLLKARNEPIIATSQGYLFMKQVENTVQAERTLGCSHTPDRTEEELNLLVDLGITVKDVRIEHPVYGNLSAPIMVSNRGEVQQFIAKINKTNASFLSELTEGIHFHTLLARSEQALDEAETALKKIGLLI
ncbi:transcription repressor NadR [Peribacillus saganii]|uniref:Transcription repressor NadR n=1 Tax=Peribacillus saganii TaxID=2303992 RepID=A0A372LUJ9_9BACI|nr:transcription repressor NadR [Peribacillus saganii]RFU71597.1 transcription repressor NadR [Peribacillus saganii]